MEQAVTCTCDTHCPRCGHAFQPNFAHMLVDGEWIACLSPPSEYNQKVIDALADKPMPKRHPLSDSYGMEILSTFE